MPSLEVILGDITTVAADAIVNAADHRMRGGGGVDGAIHRAGGPAILAECIARFPNGLATGEAGWTTGGALPATWVIHTVGPNYRAGQTDRGLLTSCYRRALQVADDLGARSVAFPLISAGVYGWPKGDAILAAIETLAGTPTTVEAVTLVAHGPGHLRGDRRRSGPVDTTADPARSPGPASARLPRSPRAPRRKPHRHALASLHHARPRPHPSRRSRGPPR